MFNFTGKGYDRTEGAGADRGGLHVLQEVPGAQEVDGRGGEEYAGQAQGGGAHHRADAAAHRGEEHLFGDH